MTGEEKQNIFEIQKRERERETTQTVNDSPSREVSQVQLLDHRH